MNTFREHLNAYLSVAQCECDTTKEYIRYLIESAGDLIDRNSSTVDDVYDNASEVVKLKKLRYYYSEIVECLELSNEVFKDLRELNKPKADTTREDPRDNNDWLNSITDQLQKTMATLNPGDYATIVVRKESTEEMDDTTKTSLSEIIKILD